MYVYSLSYCTKTFWGIFSCGLDILQEQKFSFSLISHNQVFIFVQLQTYLEPSRCFPASKGPCASFCIIQKLCDMCSHMAPGFCCSQVACWNQQDCLCEQGLVFMSTKMPEWTGHFWASHFEQPFLCGLSLFLFCAQPLIYTTYLTAW